MTRAGRRKGSEREGGKKKEREQRKEKRGRREKEKGGKKETKEGIKYIHVSNPQAPTILYSAFFTQLKLITQLLSFYIISITVPILCKGGYSRFAQLWLYYVVFELFPIFALMRSTAVNIYVQLFPLPFGCVSLGIIIGSKILTAFQLIIHRTLMSFKNTEPIYKPSKHAYIHNFPPLAKHTQHLSLIHI